ncbi:DUF3572 domain-containing protein [Microvirga thermotolerans]|uniref:DUF3572 family protein n=1 Tax=Microvirga thermotolerans TaxID=2651334 RepID=A0A5P9JYG1_9HYPH|nr:DUF3572 domain-containing protein [Microvirga thermotolerans]QFU16676.1 DUF3572 family protein [Microvirga thermotolerans]
MKPAAKKISAEEAERVALEAFSRIAADEERLGRFMAVSGLQAQTIRAAAALPGFLAGILDYVAADEPLLIALAQEMETVPERIMEARRTLSPSEFE